MSDNNDNSDDTTPKFALEVLPVNIVDEMRQSYMDYAMSVIVGRALPDVRDGLKPVHRRVLYAMRELGNDWNRAYKKSSRVVGDVIGKYHPHGDSAVYDTIVRMAQPFSLRYLQVDGQGNFGSVDGDAPAAMRYTEVRMSRFSHDLLEDLDKETVDFQANYDDSEQEPAVLPAKIPNLLVNGSSGIAVGLATNIPPHNLSEVVQACLRVIDDPEVTLEGLMQLLPGPDFPTGAIINGTEGILDAYRTGRGRVVLRARTHIEEVNSAGKQAIIITELPYQVNKAVLQEKIAELVRHKKLEGITAIRDESDKHGMRVVLELRRGEMAEVMINKLYRFTQLQNVFGINMVALLDGRPQRLGLRQILDAFINHRREVVTRRTLYELRQARKRAHVLEGLAVALGNIDEVIRLIRQAPDPATAREALMERAWVAANVLDMIGDGDPNLSRPAGLAGSCGIIEGMYHLSQAQAQAILDLRLHRLTGLEKDKIIAEYRVLLDSIKELMAILASPALLMQVIRDELNEMNEQHGDERRSEILSTALNLSLEDLIEAQNVVVTLSHQGYAKYQSLADYQVQHRGGRGKSATKKKETDFIEHVMVMNTHDTVLSFSTRGQLYWKKVYELPEASRQSRGVPVVNLFPLEEGERITAMLPIKNYDHDQYIFMATSLGRVKKTPLQDFSHQRSNGIRALDLRDDDTLMAVALTDGQSDVLLFSNEGKAIRFNETDVRPMGRTAAGVRGQKLSAEGRIVAMLIGTEGDVLAATENGYGKRTPVSDYPKRHRGGQGVIAIQTSGRNGALVGTLMVRDGDDAMLMTDGGTLVRIAMNEVSVVGRNTQGVRLIRLTGDEKLISLEHIAEASMTEVLADDAPSGDNAA